MKQYELKNSGQSLHFSPSSEYLQYFFVRLDRIPTLPRYSPVRQCNTSLCCYRSTQRHRTGRLLESRMLHQLVCNIPHVEAGVCYNFSGTRGMMTDTFGRPPWNAHRGCLRNWPMSIPSCACSLQGSRTSCLSAAEGQHPCKQKTTPSLKSPNAPVSTSVGGGASAVLGF